MKGGLGPKVRPGGDLGSSSKPLVSSTVVSSLTKARSGSTRGSSLAIYTPHANERHNNDVFHHYSHARRMAVGGVSLARRKAVVRNANGVSAGECGLWITSRPPT